MVRSELNRRDALRLSCGALLGISGCVTGGSGDTPTDESPPSVSDITTEYPTFGGYYGIDASKPNPDAARCRTPTRPNSSACESSIDSEADPVPFGELSRESRIEVANGITRAEYLTDASPAFNDSEYYDRPITYKGSTFSVSVSVADVFSEVEHGPDADPDWRAPVTFDGQIEDDALDVTVTNDLDTPLDIHHFGRPYFGVLTAVGESAALLPHDQYDDNPFIQTTGVVRSDEAFEIDYRTETLSSGQSLQETYELPDSLPENPTVGLSLPMSGSDIDMFGEYRVVAVADLPISTESSGSADDI